ncbi:MAG: alpha/beta fold hydrolase [Pseudodesulfovibrio sp.]
MFALSRHGKRYLLLAAIAALAAVALGGERFFDSALRGYLAMKGVHSRYLRKGATTIYFLEGGREHPRTVILLHGVGGKALTSWFRLLPSLAEKYHVIAPDLFFANLPDLVGSGYDVRSETSLLDLLMTGEKIGRAALVGLSFGAWPALRTAVDRPDRVERLVLVSPLDGAANEVLSLLDLDPADPGRDFYYRIFDSPPPVPPLFLHSHWDRTSAVFRALPSFRTQLEAEGRYLDRSLGRVRCPVLVLHGANDLIISAARFEAMVAAIPGGRGEAVAGSGHALVWDRADRLREAVEAFLDQGDAS